MEELWLRIAERHERQAEALQWLLERPAHTSSDH
jgi:hypothetical protein